MGIVNIELPQNAHHSGKPGQQSRLSIRIRCNAAPLVSSNMATFPVLATLYRPNRIARRLNDACTRGRMSVLGGIPTRERGNDQNVAWEPEELENPAMPTKRSAAEATNPPDSGPSNAAHLSFRPGEISFVVTAEISPCGRDDTGVILTPLCYKGLDATEKLSKISNSYH